MRLLILAAMVGVAAFGVYRRNHDPDLVYARGFRGAMERWRDGEREVIRTYTVRKTNVPRGGLRALFLSEIAAEAATDDRAIVEIDALGSTPARFVPMCSAARDAVAFLSRNAHARHDAIEDRDRAALVRLEMELDRERPRLLERMTRESNALARRSGRPERTTAEILASGREGR